MLPDYDDPDIFERWDWLVAHGLVWWERDHTLVFTGLVEHEYREALRAMLAEMKSRDILYVDASKINASDLASWRQELMNAVHAAINTLQVSIQRIVRISRPASSIESLMFEVGLRLNKKAQAELPCYNADEYYRQALRKA